MAQETVKLTRFELEVMEELWEMGRASVREVLENLPSKKEPAYTTVQTIVRRLEEKGAVRRVRKIGNAHIYEPVVGRDAAYRRLVGDFLDLFGGSAQPVMAQMAELGKIRLQDLQELEKTLQESETGGQDGRG